MRKSKSEELSVILGPLLMDIFAALGEIGVTLSMSQMMALMARAEKKAKDLSGNGSAKEAGGET